MRRGFRRPKEAHFCPIRPVTLLGEKCGVGVLAGEAAQFGVVEPGPEIVQAGGRVELVAGVGVAVGVGCEGLLDVLKILCNVMISVFHAPLTVRKIIPSRNTGNTPRSIN